MTIAIDRLNQIITLAASNDTIAENCEVEGILFFGTAAGASEVQDNDGNTIAKVQLTTSVQSVYVPINRRIATGLLAKTIATNHTVYVYLRRS